MKLRNMMLVSAFAALCSCASIEVDPMATHVLITPIAPAKNCKYLGQVVGNQGNFFTGSWTSNKNLEVGAMNDLKNQAAKLGANYVHLITNRAGNTGSLDQFGGSLEQTNVTNLGNAYSCPNR